MTRKNRHILKREWPGLRAEIAGIIKEEKIAETQFRALGVHENWDVIEEKILATFCDSIQRPVWLWKHLKLASSSFRVDRPEDYLKDLIMPDQDIYFFINDTNNRLWFYEGRIDAIVSVIGESALIDEMYFSSKKYEWLICINHHNILIATGSLMVNEVSKLKSKLLK